MTTFGAALTPLVITSSFAQLELFYWTVNRRSSRRIYRTIARAPKYNTAIEAARKNGGDITIWDDAGTLADACANSRQCPSLQILSICMSWKIYIYCPHPRHPLPKRIFKTWFSTATAHNYLKEQRYIYATCFVGSIFVYNFSNQAHQMARSPWSHWHMYTHVKWTIILLRYASGNASHYTRWNAPRMWSQWFATPKGILVSLLAVVQLRVGVCFKNQ